jgi:hypothetical protein
MSGVLKIPYPPKKVRMPKPTTAIRGSFSNIKRKKVKKFTLTLIIPNLMIKPRIPHFFRIFMQKKFDPYPTRMKIKKYQSTPPSPSTKR